MQALLSIHFVYQPPAVLHAIYLINQLLVATLCAHTAVTAVRARVAATAVHAHTAAIAVRAHTAATAVHAHPPATAVCAHAAATAVHPSLTPLRRCCEPATRVFWPRPYVEYTSGA